MRRALAVLAALLPLAIPAAARADAGDIIVQREPGTSAAEINSDAGVKRVETLPIARRTRAIAPQAAVAHPRPNPFLGPLGPTTGDIG